MKRRTRLGQLGSVGDRTIIDMYASRQYGCFNIEQTRRAGFDRSAVSRRVASGQWVKLAPKVYAVASAPPIWERQLAAAVLGFPRVRVAAGSAAYLHRLSGWRPGRPVVMIPAGGNGRSPIATVVRSKFFESIAWERVGAFEVTSVAETVFALAADGAIGASRLAATLDDSLLTGKATISDFEAIFERTVGLRARGAGRLRRLMEQRHPDCYEVGSTYLERLLERLLADRRIPASTREHPFSLGGRDSRVDALIPTWSLVVEADSRRWHNRVGDFEADRKRDNELAARGLRVVRFTYQMLKQDYEGCIRTLLAVGSHG